MKVLLEQSDLLRPQSRGRPEAHGGSPVHGCGQPRARVTAAPEHPLLGNDNPHRAFFSQNATRPSSLCEIIFQMPTALVNHFFRNGFKSN